VFDCNDNVVISETGVESVVTVNREKEKKREKMRKRQQKNEFSQDEGVR
jgi:DNA replication protein DnaD